MSEDVIGAHNGLHSEQGALPGEQRGRSANPIIKVHDVLWLEFEKPDLIKAEAFAHSFGFATALRTKDELHLRGSDAGAPCVLIRRGQREKFLGPAFVAAEHDSTSVTTPRRTARSRSRDLLQRTARLAG